MDQWIQACNIRINIYWINQNMQFFVFKSMPSSQSASTISEVKDNSFVKMQHAKVTVCHWTCTAPSPPVLNYGANSSLWIENWNPPQLVAVAVNPHCSSGSQISKVRWSCFIHLFIVLTPPRLDPPLSPSLCSCLPASNYQSSGSGCHCSSPPSIVAPCSRVMSSNSILSTALVHCWWQLKSAMQNVQGPLKIWCGESDWDL
jgi:hypothetical protein